MVTAVSGFIEQVCIMVKGIPKHNTYHPSTASRWMHMSWYMLASSQVSQIAFWSLMNCEGVDGWQLVVLKEIHYHHPSTPSPFHLQRASTNTCLLANIYQFLCIHLLLHGYYLVHNWIIDGRIWTGIRSQLASRQVSLLVLWSLMDCDLTLAKVLGCYNHPSTHTVWIGFILGV